MPEFDPEKSQEAKNMASQKIGVECLTMIRLGGI
jgi:hypothetical protein